MGKRKCRRDTRDLIKRGGAGKPRAEFRRGLRASVRSRNVNKNLKETREFTSHSHWGGTFQALGTAHAKV